MFVLTPGMKVTVYPSVEQPPTNLASVIPYAQQMRMYKVYLITCY